MSHINKMKLSPKTVVKVDLGRIAHNVRELKTLCHNTTKLMAVVKANAYGHGVIEVATKALASGADFLAVARVSEVVELRQAGISAPVLLFGDVDEAHIEYLASTDVRITLTSLDDAQRISERAREKDLVIKAHIKTDTGMGRLGLYLEPDDQASGYTDFTGIVDTIQRINNLKGIEIEGIYTLFANADAMDKSHADRQTVVFKTLLSLLDDKGLKPAICHAANSAAAIDLSDAHFDMIRPGIAMYGLWPSHEMDHSIVELKPAMSIISQIIQLKKVPPGFEVSYGRTYQTKRPSLIATVPIGYADGYSRLLSSKGWMLVRGRRAPVVGRVCMDFTMIDVSDIPGVVPGDEVVVMGCQGDVCVTADDIAELTGTINYEVTASLTRRMPLQHINS